MCVRSQPGVIRRESIQLSGTPGGEEFAMSTPEQWLAMRPQEFEIEAMGVWVGRCELRSRVEEPFIGQLGQRDMHWIQGEGGAGGIG